MVAEDVQAREVDADLCSQPSEKLMPYTGPIRDDVVPQGRPAEPTAPFHIQLVIENSWKVNAIRCPEHCHFELSQRVVEVYETAEEVR